MRNTVAAGCVPAWQANESHWLAGELILVHGLRSVRQGTVEVPNPRAVVPSNHDPMLALAPDALDALDAPELEELEEQED